MPAATIRAAPEHHGPDVVVVHAAAYTDAEGAETQKKLCWRMNVGGMRNMARALMPPCRARVDFPAYRNWATVR